MSFGLSTSGSFLTLLSILLQGCHQVLPLHPLEHFENPTQPFNSNSYNTNLPLSLLQPLCISWYTYCCHSVHPKYCYKDCFPFPLLWPHHFPLPTSHWITFIYNFKFNSSPSPSKPCTTSSWPIFQILFLILSYFSFFALIPISDSMPFYYPSPICTLVPSFMLPSVLFIYSPNPSGKDPSFNSFQKGWLLPGSPLSQPKNSLCNPIQVENSWVRRKDVHEQKENTSVLSKMLTYITIYYRNTFPPFLPTTVCCSDSSIHVYNQTVTS